MRTVGRDYSAVMPSGVMLTFRGRRCSGEVSDSVPSYYTKTVSLDETGVAPDQSGFAGRKIFHDAAVALFDVGDTDPTNQSVLDTLAEQVAKDYYRFQSRAFDVVYHGVVAPDMNALLDTVEWSYSMDGCSTRMLTGPYNGDPEELYHWDPTTAGCVDASGSGLITAKTPCLEYYGAPVQCSGGSLLLSRFKLCLVGGRLVSTFVQTDTITP